MLGIGRALCGSSSPTPLPKQGHLQQAAQDRFQAGLEYLQRRRLPNLPGNELETMGLPKFLTAEKQHRRRRPQQFIRRGRYMASSTLKAASVKPDQKFKQYFIV